MPLPHVVARFNKRVTNRVLEPIARSSPGFAVVRHVGRRSGVPYQTPLNLFVLGAEAADDSVERIVSLTYGPSADWVRNVLAGDAAVEDRRGRWAVESAEVVGRDVAWPALPRVVRAALRILRVRHFLRLTLRRMDRTRRVSADSPRA